MKFTILTCDGYVPVATLEGTTRDAVRACRRLEKQANDGWARVAYRDGRLVADADGRCDTSDYYVDAATLTGMYDRD